MKKTIIIIALVAFFAPCLFSQESRRPMIDEALEGCRDPSGEPVPTRMDSWQPYVVMARSHERTGAPEILVNPELAGKYSFSSYTLRWLYLRECAHIRLEHQRLEHPSDAAQEEADCFALRELLAQYEDNSMLKSRITDTISRDIRSHGYEAWNEMRLGQKRDPDLMFRCYERRK